MTRVQELEVKRMTPVMWEILGAARFTRAVPPRHLKSARILERRGFIELKKHNGCKSSEWVVDGFTLAHLTEAGYEALAEAFA
jgi:hypothetical protein